LGKAHFPTKDHFRVFKLLAAENDLPGGHGHSIDDDMQSGIERCIGHGRRFLGGEKCHLMASIPAADEDIPGLHGHYKGDDFQGGMERYVGHGLRKYDRSNYHRHHITDDIESEPGLHGHTKDFDYKDGMEWYIGHGKRRVRPNHNVETWRPKKRDALGSGSPDVSAYPAAGMSTRDIIVHHLARDPTRQGTHQDRRVGKTMRRDQEENHLNTIGQ
jgi:hypothetical protein